MIECIQRYLIVHGTAQKIYTDRIESILSGEFFMTNIEFGKRLRKHRKDRKLTLDQMAELVELSPNYLGDIERGKKFPGTETLIQIVNVLDISADELLKDSVNKADYIIDDELHRMMAQLSPKKKAAAVRILQATIESLEELDESMATV